MELFPELVIKPAERRACKPAEKVRESGGHL
jgi:hypothetical protein